jgi:hypothetical protein
MILQHVLTDSSVAAVCLFRHLHCVTKAQVNNVIESEEHWSHVPGFNELPKDRQEEG